VLFAMTGVLAVSFGVLVGLAYLVTARAAMSSLDSVLAREADAFSAAVHNAPAEESLAQATRAYLSGRGASTANLDPILLVAFSTGRTISNSDVRLEKAKGNTALASQTNEPGFSDVTLQATRYRVFTVPVRSEGKVVGHFQAALSTMSATQTGQRVALTLAAAGFIGLAVGLPLSYWATRRALRPLARMAADAASISADATDAHIEYVGPPDELGTLADSLNEMLGRLRTAYDEQRRFVADASHELRTPVAVIRGNTELLSSGRVQGADAEESLAMIDGEARRMTRLLDDLLALARFEGPERRPFQPLHIGASLFEVSSRARTLADREVVVTACDAWVAGDPDLLDRALVNLVKNAIAHTAPGGHITLACDADERSVRVSVTDDGPGVPAGDLQRVFDRFYRAPGQPRSREEGGAGLGLAITRKLIELHGGTVTAENVEPHGAKFTVELPRIPNPS
jgi:two-component system OmpR family sensor kinase